MGLREKTVSYKRKITQTELTIDKLKGIVRTSLEVSLSCFTNREALKSSLTETPRESLKIDSGSGLIELLREDKLEKQESGYLVTLQTALIDSAKLEASLAASADSADDSWMRAPTSNPMVRVSRRMAETETARRTDLRPVLGGRGGCWSTGLTLP